MLCFCSFCVHFFHQDPGIKASVITALSDVLAKLPQHCSEAAQIKIIDSTEPLLYSKGVLEILKAASAKCLGALLSRHVTDDKLSSYLATSLEPALTSHDTDSRTVSSSGYEQLRDT